jgi:cyclopropane fatty-acyl-phospholipid synthase-like methyltransferase
MGSASKVTMWSARLNNLWWEYRLGISTRGRVPVEHPDSVHYATMSYATIWSILRQLDLGESDVFVDIGSGKGRVLCCAARFRVKQVTGVDLSTLLCREAEENARRLRGRRAPITVANMVAQDLDYSSATVLFMFDPFGAATLGPVLERIGRDTEGRCLRLAYANPRHDTVLKHQPWLTERDFWPKQDSGLEHDVVFYRSKP